MSLLRAYLDAHGGALSAAAAAEHLGLGPTDLRRLRATGTLTRVCRGGYADSARLARADPEEAHRLRLRAVLATSPATLAASHQSAAVLLGLPLLASDLEMVHVTRRSGSGHGRRRDAFTVHRCPGERAGFRQVGGVWSVGPVAAVLGAIMSCSQIGAQGLADAALRARVVSRAQLEEGLRDLAGATGTPRARQVVHRADPSAESIGESGLRVILLLLGYRVRPQCVITDDGEFVARVDFYLPDLGVVVEFDGAVKYEDAAGRESLVREKAREDRIRRLGYGVARITWAQLYRPEVIRELVEAAARMSSRGRRT
ncbi:type IV toxin-antitoxin system AbiEi family antitoxin domain-containing protein [Ornithinimicrobium sufpigmenti]|uniref:type IV toxin-antitoxin system AbiEi family antitoxin domain-containing protein n=1 Tax=Ornithinimicrobium sufpigmenti TaxID=2508882 RepID=UPI0010359E72|nr:MULTISPECIES: type IV toxin-antitoxin system AbiEi family antitoxin domain-containing protein [unclassified Ornithinimicrobium]